MSSAHVFSEVVNVKSPNKDARRDVRSSLYIFYYLSFVLISGVDHVEDSPKTTSVGFGYPA